MRRATITEITVIPPGFTAGTRCPWCHEPNVWPFDHNDQPAVQYCLCSDCGRLYSLRLTRRWLDLAAGPRAHPFTVIRTPAAVAR